jgi:hypothetical protein
MASIEAAAIGGLICAVGWIVVIRGLMSAPPVDAPDAEIATYYSDPYQGSNALLLLQIQAVSTVGFLWFIGVMRSRLGPGAPMLAGTVFFGAGILLSGLLFVGTAALAAPALLLQAGGGPPSASDASIMLSLGGAVLSVLAPRIAFVVMFSSAILARGTGAFPPWLVVLTVALALFEFFNFTINEPTLYVFPIWVGLVSMVLLRRVSSGQISRQTGGSY